MQYKKRSLVLSLCIHLIIIGIFISLSRKKPGGTHAVHFSLITENSPLEQKMNKHDSLAFSAKSYPMNKSGHQGDSLFRTVSEHHHVISDSELSDSQRYFLQKERVKKRVFSVHTTKKDSFLANLLPDTSYPSNFFSDQISEEIKKRNTGTAPLQFPILGLFSQKKSSESLPLKLDFIPTRTQISIMDALYTKDKATQLDIYPYLRTDTPVTAEMVDHELKFLVDKGFLRRKKISPENLFIFFGIPIEMSKKNKLNPVYEYSVQIDKKKLMIFLQAKLDQLREKLSASPENIESLNGRIKHLESCIILLAS